MIAKQEAKIQQAKDEKEKIQTIAELYSTLVGIESVYNMILEVEKNGYSVSDEMIAKMQSDQPHYVRSRPLTLDEAIKAHIKKQRKYLHPLNSEALISDIQLHIKTIEQAPRDAIMLERRIAMKKKAREQERDVIKTHELSKEIEALEILRSMIRMKENGQPLDSWAY
jgi:hypothetical protein